MPGWLDRLGAVALAGCVLATALAAAPARAQIDPTIRSRVVSAAVLIAIRVTVQETGYHYQADVPLPMGSGTVVSPDGLILTNQHVVDRGVQRELVAWLQTELSEEIPNVTLGIDEGIFLILVSDGVRPATPRYTAELVREDRRLDLAVLRVTGDAEGNSLAPDQRALPYVPLGDSDAVGLGDRVQIFSFPAIGGDALTYTVGVVSGFLFKDGIYGPAWITTDAVMSGGSSGGTAINDAGQLIGVPTQGTELDCRPGDTNGDGEVDTDDVGCVPIGGSLGQIRPVNLAKALLELVDPAFFGTAPRLTPRPSAVTPVSPTPSSAAGVRTEDTAAESADCRGSVYVKNEIVVTSEPAFLRTKPDVTAEVITILPVGSWVEITGSFVRAGGCDWWHVENVSGAGERGYIREDDLSHLQDASPQRDPTSTRRPAAFGFVEDFEDPRRYERIDDNSVASYVVNGGLTIKVKVPFGVDPFVFDAFPTDGRDFSFAADIAWTHGQGEINLIVRSLSGSEGTEWTFATDPTAKAWSLYRTSKDIREHYYLVDPIDYSSLIDGPVRRIDVLVRDGNPTVLINGIDVAAPYGVTMPQMNGNLVVGFSASLDPSSLSGFSVTFDRLTLSELA